MAFSFGTNSDGSLPWSGAPKQNTQQTNPNVTVAPPGGADQKPNPQYPGAGTPPIVYQPIAPGDRPAADQNRTTTGADVSKLPNTTNLAGGWDQFATGGNAPQDVMKAALMQGMTGEAAVNYVNQQLGLQPGSSVAYDANRNIYELPNGYYVAANPQDSTKFDLIQHGPESGGGGSNASNGNISSMFQNNLDPRVNDLYNTLLGRAQQSLQVNPKDPIIAGQVGAYSAQQQRAGRNYLDQLAEKSGPNANLTSEGRQVAENEAQATGSLQASLMQNELTARRTEIQNALTEMGSMLSDQQKIALQQQLGYIDAALRQQQINSANDQFAATYDLNATNQANYWDWLRSTGKPA